MNDIPRKCTLCPRQCGANRLDGQTGYCGAGAVARVFRHGPHFGEEPPLTGTRGSGAIFFSHCTMRCIYCQNHPWSQGGSGEDMDTETLRRIFYDLAVNDRCHNWNLVSPTPWLPQIQQAVEPLLSAGISLPFVYNTSGFESLETLDTFSSLADIALCDLRYARADVAAEASDARIYVDAARKTLKWFWEHLGPLTCDANDIATRGMICRLLVLPGHADEAIASLQWLADTIGPTIHISVMSQYTPVYRAQKCAPWDRTIREDEYGRVTDMFDALGFENGWVQEFCSAEPSDLLGEAMTAGAGTAGAEIKNAPRAQETE